MGNLVDLEKKINSELATKIKFSEIKHQQLYINIDYNNLAEVLSPTAQLTFNLLVSSSFLEVLDLFR